MFDKSKMKSNICSRNIMVHLDSGYMVYYT